ncbi:MAG: lipopolysaccharide assembly protein LapB [Alphaproteobacteria bacterium]|nr:lipopolysaccharide assembly protein LapB [Alphaproteobacteria bacterium]
MELDLSWALIGLPLAFGLGWLASRLDLRQLRIENRTQPKAYFKGLNHLLNEQQDQAIDAFIEAVQQDPDTSELHFALGNLFRRRGEFERAIRVHEHLLARADLSPTDRQRARHALALDFLKAGLLDRAEDNLRQLQGTPLQTQAWLALLIIHERSRDWAAAFDVARQLSASGEAQFQTRQAHYLCEQAAALPPESAEQRIALLKEASTVAPQSVRPRLALAEEYETLGRPADALTQRLTLSREMPRYLPLLAAGLVRLGMTQGRLDEVLELLQSHAQDAPSLDVMEALATLDQAQGHADVQSRYADHLTKEPSLVAARAWLAHEPLQHESQRAALERALERAALPLRRYRCAACGFEAQRHFWQCPGCQAWDSYPPRRAEEL